MVTITNKTCAKLSLRYYDPFQVEECVGSDAYRFRLPPKARIYNVFHVMFLKKHHGDAPADVVPLPAIVHGRVVPLPSAIVRACLNRGSWELLVQWMG